MRGREGGKDERENEGNRKKGGSKRERGEEKKRRIWMNIAAALWCGTWQV